MYCFFRKSLFYPIFLNFRPWHFQHCWPWGGPGITFFQKFRFFQKCQIFQKILKLQKNSSQNAKSRIGIRDSKFLAYSYTHTSSFIFEKNHILKTSFLWNVAKSTFLKIWTFLENVKLQSTPGGPKNGAKVLKIQVKWMVCSVNPDFYPIFPNFRPWFFPKVDPWGSRGHFFQKSGKFPKIMIFPKNPKKSRKIRQKMSNHV